MIYLFVDPVHNIAFLLLFLSIDNKNLNTLYMRQNKRNLLQLIEVIYRMGDDYYEIDNSQIPKNVCTI